MLVKLTNDFLLPKRRQKLRCKKECTRTTAAPRDLNVLCLMLVDFFRVEDMFSLKQLESLKRER